jgi:hypothetical protein
MEACVYRRAFPSQEYTSTKTVLGYPKYRMKANASVIMMVNILICRQAYCVMFATFTADL